MVNILRASKLVKTLISLAVLLLIITLATPFLVKSELKKQLLAMGAESASVESLYLNIWTGYLKIEGLEATATDKPTLSLGTVETDIRYLDLWEKRLHINFLNLSGLELSASIDDEIHVGPLLIPTGGESQETTSEEEPWGWGITQLTLNDLNLHSQYQNQSTNLVIDLAELKLLQNWLPDQSSHLVLKGLLNNSAFSIDTHGNPLAESAGGNLNLVIDKLQLGPLAKPWLPGLDGVLSSDIALAIKSDGKQISLQQQGDLSLNNFSFQKAHMDIQHEALNWSGTLTTLLDSQLLSEVTTKGGFSIDGFSFKQGEQSVTHQRIAWQGSNQIAFVEQQPESINSEGKLTVSDTAFQQADLSLGVAEVDWEGKNTVAMSAGTLEVINNDGALQVKALSFEQPGLKLNNQALNWAGKIATDVTTTVSAAGELSDQQLQVALAQQTINNGSFNWSGNAEFDIKNAVLAQLGGNASIEKAALSTPTGNQLATISAVNISDLSAKQNNHVAASKLAIAGIELKNKQPLINLDKIAISSLETGAEYSKIGTLTIGKLDTELLLDKEGKPSGWTAWVEQLTGSSDDGANQNATDEAANNTDSEPSKTAYDVALGKLELSQPATIRFSDESVNARDIEIKLSTLEATDIDTQSTAPGKFKVAANINRFGNLELAGNYAWMDKATNGDWQGKIAGLELPPFSPYMQRYSGYQMQSGQFSLDTSGNIKADNVESKNVINMHNLNVKKASAEDTSEFDKQLGMPLQTALSIITDDDNNVELDIPVTGSLQDPQFGYQSVINIVMGKVAKEGAMSYLTASLQPYGALISLGRMVMDSANAINLEPVKFPSGSSELDPTALDYMSKITKLLADKESLRLNICGIAASTDQQPLMAKQLAVPLETLTPEQTVTFTPEVMKPLLTELAQQRSDNVKQHLLDQGVAQERLFNCLAEVDLESDQPRVALGF